MLQSKYIIRDYKPADFNQVNNLWSLTNMGGIARGDDAEVINRCNTAGAKLIILEKVDTNQIVGTSWLTHDSRRIYMHHFGVLPKYQGRGLSKLLLDESLDFATKLNMQIKLEVHKNNEIALKIYKDAGFDYLGDYNVYIIRNLENI